MGLKRRPEPEQPRAITAAQASMGENGSWKTFKFGGSDWMTEAWRQYDISPELRFLAAWIGDSVAKAELYVTNVGLTGEATGRVEDPDISRLAAEPLGTGAQRDENLRLWGIDLAVPGEAWVVGENAATGNPESWYVLTKRQIKQTGDEITVERPMHAGGGKRVLDPQLDTFMRSWRSHPDDVSQSDSPTRSALVPLRAIELITKREFAELDSRLVGAGVWPLPENIDFPNEEGAPEGIEGFLAKLTRVAAMSMQDQSTAGAHVPIMFTVPEGVTVQEPIRFWSEVSDHLLPMKEAAIKRVANSFEIPSDLLGAMGDSNHWTAWAISEEGIKRIGSYLTCIADALTRGFLHPALKRAGRVDFASYAYAFDTAPLAVRPNRTTESMDLYDRGLIRGKDVVEAAAFDPKQMPTEDERIREAVLRGVIANPSLLADPAIQSILGIPGTPPTVTEVLPAIPDTIDEGPPEEEPLIASRIQLPMARLMVMRALELAGGRLTTPSERSGKWAAYPRHELHSRVGPVTPDRADKVLTGAWTHLPPVAADLGFGAEDLEKLLHGYCHQLLVHGQPHDDSLLDVTLRRATS